MLEDTKNKKTKTKHGCIFFAVGRASILGSLETAPVKRPKGRCDNMTWFVSLYWSQWGDSGQEKKKRKEKKHTPSCRSWICAAVSTPNSQLNVSCIGCRREKLWFSSSVCCKNLQACVRTHAHAKTNTHTRTHQIITQRRAPAALASTPVLVYDMQDNSVFLHQPLFCQIFKRFIILFVNTRALVTGLAAQL